MDDLIWFAYGVHVKQISGGAAWRNTDRYDISGVTNVEGEPDLKQEQGMYRKLLAARFKLIFHREKRELSVYAIRVAKNGPKLTKSLGNPNGQPDSTRVPAAAQRAMRYTNNSMGDFAFSIQGFLDRPVVDQTGLPGKFDFLLKWTNDESRISGPNEAPGIFTAIQEQLGLKLEPAKALADIFVIDHVERPSEN